MGTDPDRTSDVLGAVVTKSVGGGVPPLNDDFRNIDASIGSAGPTRGSLRVRIRSVRATRPVGTRCCASSVLRSRRRHVKRFEIMIRICWITDGVEPLRPPPSPSSRPPPLAAAEVAVPGGGCASAAVR